MRSSLRANGSYECAPDDRLRGAILTPSFRGARSASPESRDSGSAPDGASRNDGCRFASSLRNDGALIQTRVYDLAARCARAVDESSAQRGRGERRVPVAPAASRALCIGRTHTSKRVHRNRPTFPHAMVLTVSFALSPVIGLVCHRRSADMVLSKPGWADLTPRT